MADTNKAAAAAATDAAFAATVNAARAMTDVAGGKTPAKPEAKVEEVDTSVADEESDDSEDTEDSDTSDESTADTDSPPAGKADAELALKLLTDGDIPGMVKALGGDPKLADTSDRKFKALREKEAKLDRKEKQRAAAHKNAIADLTTMSAKAQADLKAFRQENNFLGATRKAVSEKNWPEVAKGLTALTGMNLAELTQKLASGKVGPTESDKTLEAERAKLAAEKAEFENKKKAETEGKTNAEKRQAALVTFGEKLSGHPFLKVTKGFEARAKTRMEKTFKAWEESWDGKKFTKSPAQCADELNRELQEESKASGYTSVPKAPKPRADKRGEQPPRVGTGKGTDAVDVAKSTFEDRVARARRLSSVGQH